MTQKQILFVSVTALLLSIIFLRPSHPSAATLEGCPISLTNPDGQSLTLVKYDLRAGVHGALSLVEMEMTFRNPENRQMEGRFTYTLPPGATISRFAKEVNGKLMEGEVVERMRAQAIYTEILHTMRDPALLETEQGNRFSARVFPVPANGTVRLLLAFSKPLVMKDGVRKLTIPLAGLPKIGEFNFNCIGRPLESEIGTGVVLDKEETLGNDLFALSRHSVDFTPTKDIELTFKAAGDQQLHALKSGNFQMVQFIYNPPPTTTTALAAPPDWSFYFDTSASGADTEAPRLQVIDRLLDGMLPVLSERDPAFCAHAFDIESVLLQPDTVPKGEDGKKTMRGVAHELRSRHALGATNLEAALKDIGEEARHNVRPRIFVMVSDGIATWGARESKDLLAALGEWPAQHTLHALVIGNKQDEKILNAIVEKTHGRIVTLPLSTDVEGNVAKAIAELRAPLGAHFDAYDEGTAWIFPKTFHDVRPGQELIAFSEIKEGGKSLPGFIQRGADGKTIKDTQIPIAPVEVADFAPLLQREAYKAYLDYLEKEEQAQTDAMKRAELHKKRIEVSVKNRVLCPLTSLLVLETERDYVRFGIQRNSLSDIMAIGKSGIELRRRSPEDLPVAPPVAQPAPAKKPADSALKRTEELAKAEAPRRTPGEAKDNDAKPDASRAYRDEYRHAMLDVDEEKAAPRARRASGGQVELEVLEGTDRGVDALREQVAELRREVQGQRAAASANTVDRPLASANVPPAPAGPPATAPAPAATEAAPFARDPNGRPAVERNVQLQLASEARNPQGKAVAPEWVNYAKEIPADAQLSALRAQVEGAPRERRVRNAYADALLKAQKWDNLQAEVFQWLPFDPENPAVYEFLGKSATGLNDPMLALRAYSSIAEIAPNRAALLCRAGFLLLTAKKYDVAEAMFREALKNRQDDANIHRGLALSLWLGGNFDGACTAYETALMRDYNQRYGDVKRVLREEYAYVLRAWRKKEPAKSDAIVARAEKAGVDLLKSDALRVTMCWETDANDVDLHVVDPNGEECFYSHKNNASGLELYSDQTQGLGPEVIRTDKALPGTYSIGVNYFSAGPMGVSRGIVVVMRPTDGVDEAPQIIPFALIEGGKDMRHIGTAGF